MTQAPTQLETDKVLAVNGDEQRDAKSGRFLKGCQGGPGRWFDSNARMKTFREAALACQTPEDVQGVMSVLHAKALKGDVRAIREYLDRVIGKPDVSIQITHGQATPAEARTQLVALLEAHPAVRALLVSPVIDVTASPIDGGGAPPESA